MLVQETMKCYPPLHTDLLLLRVISLVSRPGQLEGVPQIEPSPTVQVVLKTGLAELQLSVRFTPSDKAASGVAMRRSPRRPMFHVRISSLRARVIPTYSSLSRSAAYSRRASAVAEPTCGDPLVSALI